MGRSSLARAPSLDRTVPSLVDLDHEVSFDAAAMDALVDRFAERLARSRRRGIALIRARSNAPSLVAHFGALRAGWVSMPVPLGTKAELEARWMAAYAPDLLVDDARAVPADDQGTVGGVRASWVGSPEAPDVAPGCALLLPTSGSTGSPRFVRLSAGAIDANANAIVETLRIDGEEVGLLPLPLAFAYGLSIVHSHALAGARVALTSRSLVDKPLWSAIDATRVTSIPSVPYGYQLLARTGFLERKLPHLRTMTQAGGRLERPLASRFLDELESRGVRFFAMYGQSEAAARIAVVPAELAREKLGSAGRAIPGGQLEIDDGRVLFRGPSVMLGYAHGREDLARGDELGGLLHTGDTGTLDADGFLWITGRVARFAKLHGVRMNLDDLEASLDEFGPHAVVERAEKLVVVLEGAADPSAVAARLAERFGIHPISVRVRTGEELPRLPSGKVAYQEIP